MRGLIIIIFCLSPFTLLAQSSFTITGFGKAFKDGDKIFLTYRQEGKVIYDSTLVQKGSFKFKGSYQTMVKGYVCRNDNPRYAAVLFDSFNVYIEAGHIILNSPDTLNNALISGTPLNNDYAKLIAALKPVHEKKKKLKDPDKLSTEELQDTAFTNLIKTQNLAVFHETFPIQFNFVNTHTNSFVSLITLGQMARSSAYLAQVEKSFDNLHPKLKSLPEGKEIARRIIEGKKIKIGMMAKDFTQNDVNGLPIKLSSYAGKYVLVDFWASWCLPCREENPNILAMYEQYKTKNFTVLGVSIDILANKTAWLKAIKDDQLPWMQVSDLKRDNEAAKLYGITTIPANVLIDPSGKIIAKDLKGKELRDKLAMLLVSK